MQNPRGERRDSMQASRPVEVGAYRYGPVHAQGRDVLRVARQRKNTETLAQRVDTTRAYVAAANDQYPRTSEFAKFLWGFHEAGL